MHYHGHLVDFYVINSELKLARENNDLGEIRKPIMFNELLTKNRNGLKSDCTITIQNTDDKLFP